MTRSLAIRRAVLTWAAACAAACSVAWAAGNWTETSDSDFDLGTHDRTYRAGAGASAEVRLDFSGRAAGLGVPAGAAWYDARWQYRRAISIDSAASGAVTDYQVLLVLDTLSLVSGGRMKADGSDIRFAGSDGVTLLPYWIESGMNGAATRVWVKVPSIPAGGTATVYLYYGYASASAASSVTDTFVFADDFAGADGASPDASKWASIQSGSPASGSGASILGSGLRLRLGSASGTSSLGLRSSGSPSFASGLRYRVKLKASSLGTGTTSMITLCPTSSAFAELEQDWVRFQLTHTPTPRYRLDKNLSFIPFTLVSDADTAAAVHDVEFRLATSSMVVLLDGVQIYSTSGVNFSAPFVYLESKRNGSSLQDLEFDTLLVTKFVSPEPAQGTVGAEQGRYESSGTYTSRVLDSGAVGSQVQRIDWDWTLPAGGSITIRMRAHESDIGLASFVAVSSGGNPGVQGRYMQYLAELQTPDVRATPALSSVTLSFTAEPRLPGSFAGAALSTHSVRWSWTDDSGGPWQEDGIRVYSSTGGLVRELPADTTEWIETFLSANQEYRRYVQAFNAVGATATAVAAVYTKAPAPSATVDKSTGVWYTSAATFTFTNQAGFGAGAVAQYRYAWDTSPTRTWTDAESSWSAGTLQRTTSASGVYYLHLRSYNGGGLPSGDADLGPFFVDRDFPSVTSFNPSSAPWTNASLPITLSLADSGGAGLLQLRHQFTTSPTTPLTGWSTPDTSVTGNSATVQRVQFVQGVWYLHVEATDRAGNVTNANSGPYQLDLTPPSGSVTINNGSAFATVAASTLTLSWSDSPSGVVQMRCRNSGAAWPSWEAPVATKTWTLTAGEGLKTAECELKDASGNVATVSDAITVSKATTLTLPAITTPATGSTAGQTKSFFAMATLTYSPTGGPVSGINVTFAFEGVNKSALTDPTGRATVSYTAPATTGTYAVTANFPGDINYTGSSANSSVNVEQRATLIVAFNTTADTGGTATLQANLFDIDTLENLPGRPVSIAFQGSTSAVVTDSLGIARTTFTVPSASGTYPYSASYAGDPTYRATVGGANVVVALRDTLLLADTLSTFVNETFNARATLIQRSNGSPLAGRAVSFVFRASTVAAVTDSNGVALAGFPAGPATASETYSASFDGTSDLSPSTAAASLTIGLRPVLLVPVAVSTTIATLFPARATIVDSLSATPVSGLAVAFHFEGATQTVLTDALGAATTSFLAPAASGTYVFSASFAGNATYQARSATAPVTALRRLTSLAAPNILANAASVFAASATLRDVLAGASLVGAQARIVFQGSTRTATTDAQGIAVGTFTAPTGIGDYVWTAAYDGTPVYEPAYSSGVVSVNTRLTTLAAAPASARWGEVFTASATLREQATSQPVSARVVRFLHRGATVNAVTGSDGVAGAVFANPASTGTFGFTADFDGDAVYVGSSSSATASSSARPVNLAPQDVSVPGSSVFTASATLTDGLSGAGVSGRSVDLSFEGSTATAVTDGAGLARSTFTAAGLPRASTVTAVFAGDALYQAATRTAQVAVGVRASALAAPDVSVIATQVFTATATLTDGDDGAPLVTRSVDFVFQGSTTTRTTNGFGNAYAAIAAPASTGTYVLDVRFAGDATYASRNRLVNVDVRRFATGVDAQDVQASVNSTFTAVATLRNTDLGTFLAGRAISFWFAGATQTAVTDSLGVASTTFVTDSSTRVAAYNATFGGDATMGPSYDAGQVGIGLRFTSVVPFDYTGFALDPFPATAILLDRSDGSPIAGRSLVFQFQAGSSSSPPTDETGRSSVTFTAPASSGTYGLTADFAGSSIYVTSSGTSTIRVLPRPTYMTRVTGGAWWCYALDSAYFPVLLIDGPSGNALAGKTVAYGINGTTASAVTAGDGVASVGYYCGTTPGVFSATGTFGGDATYASSLASGTFPVYSRPTQTSAFSGSVLALSSFSISALLQDMAASGANLSGKTLVFGFLGSTRTGVSDGLGKAWSNAFVAPASSGAYSFSATFPGDVSFTGSSSTNTIGVSPRPTTLTAYDTWPWALDAFSLRADLTDSLWGNAIAGKTVTFTITVGTAAYTRTGITNASGQAFSALFPAIATSATYGFTATFADDPTYSASTGSANGYVSLRWTSIGASPVEANINAPFIAQATLFDAVTNGVVAGKPLQFVFNGSTITALTNASGVASATFTATSQVGIKSYSVSFPGDISFRNSSNTGQVTQVERRVALIVYTQDVSAGRGFEAQAQAIDQLNGTGLAGTTLSFTFQGVQKTAVTDAVGFATAPYTAPVSTASYPYYAAFAGDSTFSATNGTGTLNVLLRPTALSAQGVVVAAQDGFWAVGRILDGDTSEAVAGRTIRFQFQGVDKTAVTDSLGIASVTYTAPSSTGSYSFYATFLGDSLYEARSDTGTLTAIRRNSSLGLPEVGPAINQPFSVTGTLSDAGTGARLAGRSVSFTFQGSTVTAVTDAQGQSSASFAAPASSGSFAYSASFSGDPLYEPVTQNAAVVVSRRPTLLLPDDLDVLLSDPIVPRAKLLDSLTGGPAAGRTLRFTFASTTQTAVTDSLGIATVTYSGLGSQGTTQYYVNFLGDSLYEVNNNTATIIVAARPTILDGSDVFVRILDPFGASVSLSDSNTGARISGRTIYFAFGSSSGTAATNASGIATVNFWSPASSGTYSFSATFLGDASYNAFSTTRTVTVLRRSTSPQPDPITVYLNDNWTARGTLADTWGGGAIPSKPVEFRFSGTTITATTNGSGVATAVYAAPIATGSYSYTAMFGGDATYASSTQTATLSVIRRPSILQTTSVSVEASNGFSATAQLKDSLTNAKLSGRAVAFSFQGVAQNAVTDGNGNAGVSYAAPGSSVTVNFNATFLGDATYVATSDTTTVDVVARSVVFSASNVVVNASAELQARASYTDYGTGAGLAGRTVTFDFQGSTKAAVTSSLGVATVTYTAPALTGAYEYSITVFGNAVYRGGSATGTVTVNQFQSAIGVTSASPEIGTVFYATATLTKLVGGDPLGGKLILFTFGGVNKSAFTNAGGVASVDYTAPGSSGTYVVTASFAGDADYSAANGNGEVTVGARPTLLAPGPQITVNALDTFYATGTLTRQSDGSAVTGRYVSFSFQSLSKTGGTDGVGKATATLSGPSTGTWFYTASFPGDGQYKASVIQGTVTVNARATTLVAENASAAYANETFIASATLTDDLSGAFIQGQTISFLFNGEPKTAITSAVGLATASYSAGASSGTHNYTAQLVANNTYLGFADNANSVTVNPRPATLSGQAASGPVNAVFYATATLTDDRAGNAPIAGKTITFNYGGTPKTAVTNASGVAAIDFNAGGSSGTYNFTASFAADATYLGASDGTNAVTVTERNTLLAGEVATAYVNAVFTATATLTDTVNGTALAGKNVTITYNGTPQTVATDASGRAIAAFNAGASSGTYNYTASFAGDASYSPSSDNANAVNVNPRLTTLAAQAATVYTNEVFTASGTLTDDIGGGIPLASKTIAFTYGSPQNGNTNGAGLATVTFNAGSSSGTYNYTASFAGDAGYSASVDNTNTVTIQPRPATLSAQAVPSIYVSQVFTASATLTDDRLGGAAVNGQTITFVYRGETKTGTTDASGLATVTYDAGPSSGTLNYTAQLLANGTFLGFSDNANAVTVNPRPTALAAQNVSAVYANNVFTASATLTDTVSGAGVSGKTVTFTYLGTPLNGTTNGSGLATVTFNAGASSGTKTLGASFASDSAYVGSSDNAKTVTVNPRPTSLAGQNAVTNVNRVFSTSATLTDLLSGAPISGKTLTFTYLGASNGAVTDGAGLASYAFNSGPSSGTVGYAASFAADATYLASSDTSKAATVDPRPTTLAGVAVPSVYANEVFTASATLTDILTGNAVSGRAVTFVYLGQSSSSLTNPAGLATVTYNAGSSSGVYTFTASYPGEVSYAASSEAGKSVTVLPRPTSLAAVNVPGVYATEVFTASATLTDLRTGAAIAGKTVTFVYLGQSSASLTNASGLATVTYAAGAVGTVGYTASFPADATYVASSDTSKTVTVLARPTSLAGANVSGIYTSQGFTAQATLTDIRTGTPIAGKTVTFSYLAASSASLTNPAGLATVTYNTGLSSGTKSLSSSFAGDTTYLASSDTSKTVVVDPRTTSVAAVDVASVYANEVFTASATLTDTVGGSPVAGKAVAFVYLGQSSSSLTNASGLATVTYNAGASSGTKSFAATFTADATYVGSADNTRTATVAQRPTALAAQNASTYVSQIFTASATLTDTLTGNGVPGRTVTFVYLGQSSSSLTNANGLATVTYNAGASSGTVGFTASFAADPTYVGSSDAAKSASVAPRPTTLAGVAVPGVYANEVFTASATLTDDLTGNAVSGRTVTFVYLGQSSSSLTNPSGLATVTYNAGPDQGAQTFTASYAGEVTYVGASEAGKTVTVNRRPTSLAGQSVLSVYANMVFTASATLTDIRAGTPLAGKTVTFVYLGQSSASLTNAAGLATVTYDAGPSSGTKSLNSSFASDNTYLASSDTAKTATVAQRPTALTANAVSAVYANGIFTASATLVDTLSGSGVSGRTVTFVYLGQSSSSLTNASGLATVTYNAGPSSGTLNFTASAAADATYLGSSDDTNPVTIAPRPTGLAAQNVAAVYANNVFTASATLTDIPTGNAVSGRTVTFVYLGQSSSSLTNASGLATVTYDAGSSSGTVGFTATFAADATYLGSNDNSRTVTVNPRPLVVAAQSVAAVYANDVFTASATATDGLSGQAVSGKTVAFDYLGASSSSLTNPAGLATVTYNAGASSGTKTLEAFSAANATYLAALDNTKTVSVNPRPTGLAAVNVPAVYANSVFTASATLTDALTGNAVSGRIVTFSYLGQSSSSLTNPNGLATVTYNSGPNQGTFVYAATFTADATYVGSFDNVKTVTVIARPSALAAVAVPAVYANMVFTASATLTDALNASPLAGKTVTFTYLGASSSSITNAAGLATVTYNAGASSGTKTLGSTFAGDPTYLTSSDDAKTVTVAPRPTVLAAVTVPAVFANEVFTASATLTDGLTGAAITGKSVVFTYRSNNASGPTGAGGLGAVSFGAGASSGTVAYTAAFAADATYVGSSDATQTVTVNPRPTTLAGQGGVSVFANSVFTATATLTDDRLAGAPVSGQTVVFAYQGTTQTGVTDATGRANAVFGAGPSSGTYNYTATFAPNATYLGSSDLANSVDVSFRPSQVTITAVPGVPTTGLFTASATIRDLVSGGALSGRNVSFHFNGSTITALTDGAGLATVLYTAPPSSGSYVLQASVAIDPPYDAAWSASAVPVLPRPTGLVALDVLVRALAVFTTTATLTDAYGGVGGATLLFTFDGTTRSVTTNGSGVAVATFTAPSFAGTQSYTVAFATTAAHAASSATAVVTTIQRPTDLLPQAATVLAGNQFSPASILLDRDTGGPLPGQTVTFFFQGSSQTGTTDGLGSATTSYWAPSSSGTYPFNSSFAGTAAYIAVSSGGYVVVQPRPTSLAAESAAAYTSGVFNATATLRDVATSLAIAGRQLSFTFNGTTLNAATDGTGKASVQFTAPASSGSYSYSVQFAVDATYVGASSAAAVAVNPRPTILDGADVSAAALNAFSVQATLTDGVSLGKVAGRTVSFVFQGSTRTGLTDGLGRAATTFFAPAVAGSYGASAYFAADPAYTASSDTIAVTVLKRVTVMRAENFNAQSGSVFSATGTLRDLETSAPLSGATVQFTFYVIPGFPDFNGGLTDGNGVAGATFTAPGSPATYEYVAKFQGSATYDVSLDTGHVVVGKPSRVLARDVEGLVLSPITLTAQLIDNLAVPIANHPLRFTLAGATQTVNTDSQGNAAATFTAPASSGVYSGLAEFLGDAEFGPSADQSQVTIRLRPTSLAAFDTIAFVNNAFTAKAKLFDVVAGGGIAGSTVTFSFQGSSGSALTDASGIAATSFAAPASSGPAQFTVGYYGSSTYEASDDTATVSVDRIPTALILFDQAAAANNPVTASGRVVSLLTGQGLAGKVLSMSLEGVTKASLTDSLGQATTSFIAPSSSGAYPLSGSFSGDGTYQPATGNSTIAVGLRLTTLALEPVTVPAQQAFVATTTLTDRETGLPLAGKPVTLSFQSSSAALVTDSLGVATAAFTAPTSSGAYTLTAAFQTDATYAGTSTTTPVAVQLRPTAIALQAFAVLTSEAFVTSATVTDVLSGLPLNGVQVAFDFAGFSRIAFTGADGVAITPYSAPASSGSYRLVATIQAAEPYDRGSSTTTISVLPRPASLVPQDAAVLMGDVWTATATLTDSAGGAPVAGRQVSFVLGSTTKTAATDSFGVAVATFAAPASSGAYAYGANFAGDATFAGVSTLARLDALRRPLAIDLADLSVAATRVFTATATLSDQARGTPAAGLSVRFEFGSSSATAVSSASGLAAGAFTAPAATGAVSLTASFGGDGTYLPGSSTATVTITSKPSLVLPVDVDTFANEVFKATVTLSDAVSAGPLAGRTVSLVFNGSTTTVVTDEVGRATTSLTAPASSGTFVLTARFAGDGGYASDARDAQVRVALRPTAILAGDIAAVAVQAFDAQARLMDHLSSAPLAGFPLAFVFEGATQTLTTAGDGRATASFTAPASSGTYPLMIRFDGSTVNDAALVVVNVVVGSGGSSGGGSTGGATILVLDPASAETGRVFTASATLMQSLDRAPVANKQVSFLFQGTTVTATTNAVGLATGSFTAPLSSGAYVLAANFGGDGVFNASSATGTAMVLPAASLVGPVDVVTRASGLFIATATLSSYGSPVAGRTLSFHFDGSTVTTTTNASGLATALFAAPASSGAYSYSVTFSGDARYAAASAVGSVQVDAGGGSSSGSGGGTTSAYLVGVTTHGMRGLSFAAQAILSELDSRDPIPGRAVTFTFQGSTLSAVTDAAGRAAASFTAPMTISSYPFSAAFVGDSTYTAVSTVAYVLVGLGRQPSDPLLKISTINAVGPLLAWDRITLATDGTDLTPVLQDYLLERAESVTGRWETVAVVALATAPSYQVANSTINVLYYRVRARTTDAYYSAGANVALVDRRQAEPTRVFVSDDNAARVEVPPLAAAELSNSGGPERSIVVQRQTVPGFLAAYNIRIKEGDGWNDNFRFTRTREGFTLKIDIEEVTRLATQQAFARGALARTGPRAGGSPVLFFYNGVEWVKLGGLNDPVEGEVSIQLRRPGQFAVRFDTLASSVNLTKVAPRVFSPNEADDKINKARFYLENPQAEEVTLRIFDRGGGLVRRNGVREVSGTGVVLYWDGRDDSGKVVKGGVYIYQLETGGKEITGVVVVAK